MSGAPLDRARLRAAIPRTAERAARIEAGTDGITTAMALALATAHHADALQRKGKADRPDASSGGSGGGAEASGAAGAAAAPLLSAADVAAVSKYVHGSGRLRGDAVDVYKMMHAEAALMRKRLREDAE
jgi:hypothetical protein